MRKLTGIAVCVSMVLIAQTLHAALIQSNGTGGGDWTTGATWQGGQVPASTDDVIILEGDVVQIVSGILIHSGSITLNYTSPSLGEYGTLWVGQAGGTLINEGVMNIPGTLIVFRAGDFVNRGTLIISGDGTTDDFSGRVRNDASGTIEIEGTEVTTYQFANYGTINVQYSETTSGIFQNYDRFDNYGEFNLLGPGLVPEEASVLSLGGDNSVFRNFGTLRIEENQVVLVRFGARLVNEDVGTLINETNASVQIGEFEVNSTAENKGTWTNGGNVGVFAGSTLVNGFCGRLTNNATINNSGLIKNCGLIDGMTGVGGININDEGVYETSGCGSGVPTATLEVRLQDADSGNPIPGARVSLERACLPMAADVPFLAISGGAAVYFLGAIEPAQYELKIFAPGHRPLSGYAVSLQSAENRVETIVRIADARVLNTLRVDIALNTGGNLVTDNFQVTQGSGDPFHPVVLINGFTMDLVGLDYGATQADALIEDFSVTPANVTFIQSAPGTIVSSESAVSVGDVGAAQGDIVFSAPPPSLAGYKLHFKQKTEGSAPPVAGQPITGAAHVFGSASFVATGNPAVFNYLVDVNAATYYVVLSNDQNTIISNVPEVTIAAFPATTQVPYVYIAAPAGDADGDGLLDSWETSKGLSASSSASPNGAIHDKEGDGLTNIEEFTLDIHPGVTDTDGDGHADGFERYAGSNPKVVDTPPLMAEVFVRKDFNEMIQVGTITRPVSTMTAANNRVAYGGTIKIQNPGSTAIAFPGAVTLGSGNKAMTLRKDNPTGPHVRLGATN